MTNARRVSVVIPTYQRRASVLRALEALARQTIPPQEYEVIVSIDGSDDGTVEEIGRFRAPFVLKSVWHPNRGRAAARNAGLELASGDLIVLLDDDMEPEPGFLAAHLRAHPEGSCRGVVGAVPIVVGDRSPPVVGYLSRAFQARLEALARRNGPLRFNEVFSGNFSVRRETVARIGGFDQSFALYGHEDYEWAFRLTAMGVELGYSPDAVALQHVEKELAQLARDGVSRGRTAVLFAAKHPEAAGRLKLSTYQEGGWRWRALRAVLLRLGGLYRGTPDGVLAALGWLERRGSPRMESYYAKALDYFYWVGVRAALAEQPAGSGRPRFDRIAAGLLLLLLYSAISDARWLYSAGRAAMSWRRTDEITAYESRFHELRSQLPSRGVVGYFDGLDSAAFTSTEFKRYVLTQYALAPVLVVRDTSFDLVIANFRPGVDSGGVPPGLQPIRDFGNGLMLLRRQAR